MRIRGVAPAWVLSLVVVVAGCGGAPTSPPASSPAAASTAPSGPPSGPATPAPADGEEAAEPAPPAKTFAALRAAAMACPTLEDGTFEDCEAHAEWNAEQPAFEEGKANAALLQMLSDKDRKARLLAAEKLRLTVTAEEVDAKLVDRWLGALAAEREESVLPAMVALITGQDLMKAGAVARAVEAFKAHPSATVHEDALLNIGFFNRHESILAWAELASRDPSSRMRNAAVGAAGYQAQAHAETVPLRERACKVLDKMRSDKDDFVRNRARSGLAGGECLAFFPKLVDDVSRVELKPGGFGVDSSHATALKSICRRSDIDPKLRARAAKASTRLAEAPGISANTRFYALDALALCDAALAKAVAAKLVKDPEALVAKRAKELAP